MKHDPTMTKRLILSYESILGKLVTGLANLFILKVEKTIKPQQLKKRDNKEKIRLTIIDDLDNTYDLYELEYVRQRARNIIRRYMNLSYRKGVEKGVSDLTRLNINTSFMMTRYDLEAVDIFIGRGVSLVRGATDDMKKNMLRVISEGIVKGDSIQVISKELVRQSHITRDRAKVIARTETIDAYNQASINQYKKAGIEQFRWIAAYDERTCPECEGNDGKVFDIGDEQPPAHCNCRCSTTPYIDEETTPS